MTSAIHAENVRQIKYIYLTTEQEVSGLYFSVLLIALFLLLGKKIDF